MTKYRFSLLMVIIPVMISCKAAQSDQYSSYVYAKFFDTLLPLQSYEEQSKLSLSETESFRLASLNNNIRLSLSNSINICDAQELNYLLKISKDCSSVVLYAVDEDALSSVEKDELNVYKQHYEFNHLSGNTLKKATIYGQGVLFEYASGDGLATYYYEKELDNSKLFQYSFFDAPIGLFENVDPNHSNNDIEQIAVNISFFLNHELSIEEFMGLDLDITVISVEL